MGRHWARKRAGSAAGPRSIPQPFRTLGLAQDDGNVDATWIPNFIGAATVIVKLYANGVLFFEDDSALLASGLSQANGSALGDGDVITGTLQAPGWAPVDFPQLVWVV